MTICLPKGLHAYKRTASFSEVTVPAGLLGEHATKEGVWGLIHVEEGQLSYVVVDPRRAASSRLLTAGTPPGVVEPTIVHRVQPVGAVRFRQPENVRPL